MKLLLDFFPIVLFFAAFKLFDIYVATAVAILGTVAQMAWLRYQTGRIEPMQWLSLGVIVVFGGATLLAHDETFIKWKPTVLYSLMAMALWGTWWIGRRNLIRTLMSKQIDVPDTIWLQLLHAWAGFFTFMAGLNLWVAYHFDTETWVNFKLFGGMGLMFIFVLAQALYLGRYIREPEA
jgi:intracellular septation protein